MGSSNDIPLDYLVMTDEDCENTNKDYAIFQEWQEAYRQARMSARKSILSKLAKREVMESMPKYFKDKLETENSVDPKYFAFITVNPRDNTLDFFDVLHKHVKKCVNKRWVTQYAYCYEQRSTDPDNIYGLHCHMILHRGTKRPCELEREVKSTFKHLCGDSRHIDIQWKKKEWLKDKEQYMNGKKYGEGKDAKVEVDEIMYKKLGLTQRIFSNYILDATVSDEEHKEDR